MYKRILVGTDGSSTAAKAVDRAVDVARAAGASMTILSEARADK
jgi:nucleotide-binding universal stress UspA family protein